jgi:hypothetical protein
MSPTGPYMDDGLGTARRIRGLLALPSGKQSAPRPFPPLLVRVTNVAGLRQRIWRQSNRLAWNSATRPLAVLRSTVE